jgi:hypothetical protein
MLTERLLEMARKHSERLAEDIPLARTRDEHIRVTARANEALELYKDLQSEYNLFSMKNASFNGELP